MVSLGRLFRDDPAAVEVRIRIAPIVDRAALEFRSQPCVGGAINLGDATLVLADWGGC